MSETDRKSNKEIRLNSGQNFYIKDGTTDWENLGKLVSGKISRKTDTVDIELADGEVVQKGGKRSCSLQIVLAQNSKTILDRIDSLERKSIKAYYDNGGDGGTYQEFFFPEVNLVPNFDLELKGSSHQSIAIEVLIQPQSSPVSCTPGTDLPAVAHSESSSLVTGANPYYVIVESTTP